MTMTDSELEALREKLIQTALTIAFAIEDIDKILIPTGPELNPPKPVRWGLGPNIGLEPGMPKEANVPTTEKLFSGLKKAWDDEQ